MTEKEAEVFVNEIKEKVESEAKDWAEKTFPVALMAIGFDPNFLKKFLMSAFTNGARSGMKMLLEWKKVKSESNSTGEEKVQ